VVADGAVRQVQLLADLPVAQPFGGQPRDLQFLGGQQAQRAGGGLAAALTGGAQLVAGALRPGARG
jgi:hypothetical protein